MPITYFMRIKKTQPLEEGLTAPIVGGCAVMRKYVIGVLYFTKPVGAFFVPFPPRKRLIIYTS